MPITVTCDECAETHRVRDDAVGKLLKCKGCGRSLKIEAPAPHVRVRVTRSNASPKRTWSQMVIPIVIAAVAALPAWSLFGPMLQDPRTFVVGLMLVIVAFVAVGLLPWFLYVNLRANPVTQQPEVDVPEFSAESFVWRASGGKGQSVSVIVDRSAGMIHFENCATQGSFWPGTALPWFSCSLSDLRSFHNRPVKYGSALVIKTDFGKVTVLVFCDVASFQALLQAMHDVIPGGHRRFHEDSLVAILLYVLSGGSTAVLALFLVPAGLSPLIETSLVLGAGVAVTLAVHRVISTRGRK